MLHLLLQIPNVMISELWSKVPGLTLRAMCCQGKKEQGRGRKFKAVIFDMGGVLIPPPVLLFDAMEEVGQIAPGIIAKVITKSGTDGAWKRLEQGDITLSAFILAFNKEVTKEAGKDVNFASLLNAMRGKVEVETIPEMMAVVKRVRAEGLKTALLTNNWYTDEQKSLTLVLVDQSLFDVVTESCRVGLRKPHLNIYNRCLAGLGVEAQDVVYLDDMAINLTPALQLGMATIEVKKPSQAIKELEAILGMTLRS